MLFIGELDCIHGLCSMSSFPGCGLKCVVIRREHSSCVYITWPPNAVIYAVRKKGSAGKRRGTGNPGLLSVTHAQCLNMRAQSHGSSNCCYVQPRCICRVNPCNKYYLSKYMHWRIIMRPIRTGAAAQKGLLGAHFCFKTNVEGTATSTFARQTSENTI